MIHCTFVWFFSFSRTSYVVPVVLYSAKNVSQGKVTHILHVKIKTPKEEWKLKIYLIFCFWIKQSYRANSMKKASSMNKDSINLRKPHFGWYFCHSIFNFKNLIILFWNIWIIYGSWKSWKCIMFDSEDIKNNS